MSKIGEWFKKNNELVPDHIQYIIFGIIVVVYGYQRYAESGLYKILVEQELSLFGFRSTSLELLLPFVVYAIILHGVLVPVYKYKTKNS